LYWFECALARAFLAEQNGSVVLTERARDALLSGLESDPNWAPHWANLSALQWEMGESQSAFDSIAKAMRIAPNNAKYPQFQGFLYETSGEYTNAYRSYLRGLTLDPWLSFDPYFQETEVRNQVLNDFRRSFVERHRNDLWGAWYSTSLGDLETAHSIFDQVGELEPENALVYAGLAYVALQSGNLSEALTLSKEALFIQPLMPRSLEIAYYAAHNLGLTVEASKYNDVYYSSQLESSQSWQYYNRTFLKFFIPPDTVPQFSLSLIGKLE
jgi:tetratricopeptide (TPR) repeat protein